MEIDLANLRSAFHDAREKRGGSRHAPSDRLTPSIFQYDYLSLDALSADIHRLIEGLALSSNGGSGIALDIGCGNSPYRGLLQSRSFAVKTMDIDDSTAPDFVGVVEDTKLSGDAFDLVLCTQVLEHTNDPELGLREIRRILRPGGHLIVTTPHVWFYHPHPSDNWRFTQEGLTRLVARAGLEPLRLLAQGGSVLSYFQIVNFLMFGVLGRLGAPLYALNNLVGKISDQLLRNTLFCGNFALLARKPAREASIGPR